MADWREARRVAVAVLALVLLAGMASWAVPQASAEADDGRAWKILYAGLPGSEREKDFVEFLRKYFGKVETADLKTLKESQCAGFDVAIFDYDGDPFKAPRPNLSAEFSRPVVTVGVPGAFICSMRGLKTGYL